MTCAREPRYLFQRGVGDATARQAQATQVLLQGLEEPLDVGAAGLPGDGVAQLTLTATLENRVRDVGLNQGRDAGSVLRVVGPRNRRLSKKAGTVRNVVRTPNTSTAFARVCQRFTMKF